MGDASFFSKPALNGGRARSLSSGSEVGADRLSTSPRFHYCTAGRIYETEKALMLFLARCCKVTLNGELVNISISNATAGARPPTNNVTLSGSGLVHHNTNKLLFQYKACKGQTSGIKEEGEMHVE